MALPAANKLPLALAAPLCHVKIYTARGASVFLRTSHAAFSLGSDGRPEVYYDLCSFSESLPRWLLGFLERQIFLQIIQRLMQNTWSCPISLFFFFLVFLSFFGLLVCLKVVTFLNLKVAPLAFSIACFSVDLLLHRRFATYSECIFKISGSWLWTVSINLHFAEANCWNSVPMRYCLISKKPNYSMTTQACGSRVPQVTEVIR